MALGTPYARAQARPARGRLDPTEIWCTCQGRITGPGGVMMITVAGVLVCNGILVQRGPSCMHDYSPRRRILRTFPVEQLLWVYSGWPVRSTSKVDIIY